MMPVMTVLDANTNMVVEASEIADASKSLLKLDNNGDGKLSATELEPQRPAGAGQQVAAPPQGMRRPISPVMAALDGNGDSELDASEIGNASTALAKLDTNKDGQLTMDELMPKRPGGFGGRGGPPQGNQ
jgi:Ca2+-binding EF-hand superfamily protein